MRCLTGIGLREMTFSLVVQNYAVKCFCQMSFARPLKRLLALYQRACVARRFSLQEAENVNAAAENREDHDKPKHDRCRRTPWSWMV
jgi:hypothetical protein